MTRQSTFKRKVRARMTKTGESYTAARRRLIEAGETPATNPTAVEPRVSDDAVRNATGRTWAAWFELLDAVTAPSSSAHRDRAAAHRRPRGPGLVGAERHGRLRAGARACGRRASGPTAGR